MASTFAWFKQLAELIPHFIVFTFRSKVQEVENSDELEKNSSTNTIEVAVF